MKNLLKVKYSEPKDQRKRSENAQKNVLTSGVKESHERKIKTVINAFQSHFMAATERINKHVS